MRTQSGEVRREALPQGEYALVLHHLDEHIDRSLVLRLAVDHFHVLDTRLRDIDRHRGHGGYEAAGERENESVS